MKWRVMLELVGPDGIVCVHEVGGRAAVAEYAPRLIGLTLEEGKHLLAALQVHLVQAQAEDHCRGRRRCQHCGAQRPLKDQRSRRSVSLFGTVEVRAPRFTPCRCAVTCRRTLNPVAEIMPDRCTPEYERTVAKMGSLLPYRRARTLLAEFLPLGKPTGRGNRPAANPSCWHQAGAGGCRGGGIQAGGGDEIYRTLYRRRPRAGGSSVSGAHVRGSPRSGQQ
jgi:hypothetical protein